MAKAAAGFESCPALNHGKVSDCGFGNTTPTCMELGMGPQYDCSGLVIAALSTVLGKDPHKWSTELRHVRQMWNRDNTAGDLSVGALPVIGRWYDIDGGHRLVPAHIGVVVSLHDTRFLHAVADKGKVVSDTVGPEWYCSSRLLGFLAPESLVAALG